MQLSLFRPEAAVSSCPCSQGHHDNPSFCENPPLYFSSPQPQARATVLAPFLAPEKDQQASGSCRAPLCHGLVGTGVQKAKKNLGKI